MKTARKAFDPCRAGGGKIELVRPLTIMLKLLLYIYMPMREELHVAECAKHTLQSAKHEHSRGVWGHAPTGNF